jgi:hypothetical protein
MFAKLQMAVPGAQIEPELYFIAEIFICYDTFTAFPAV